MQPMTLKNKAQSLLDYALLISVVTAAIVGMQVYVKRGLQAKYRSFMDGTAEGVALAAQLDKTLDQYEPYYKASLVDTEKSDKVTKTYVPGGGVKQHFDDPDEEIKDENGNLLKGNVIKRSGWDIVGRDLSADDEWEKAGRDLNNRHEKKKKK